MPQENPETQIRCWSCGARRGLVELLDANRELVCQPVCDSFTVFCTDCRAELWLDFNNNGSVAVGQMIGFGTRPDVDDYQSVRLDGPVEVDFIGQSVSYLGKVWRYR